MKTDDTKVFDQINFEIEELWKKLELLGKQQAKLCEQEWEIRTQMNVLTNKKIRLEKSVSKEIPLS